ncbi:MAG TPA: hypothetical protein VIH67_05335, partial [Candidatus Acidoferrum sp.]
MGHIVLLLSNFEFLVCAAVDLCVVFVSFLSAVVLSINVSNGVKTKSRALIASWQGKQVFEHYLVGRFAVVFVKILANPRPPVEAY